jgi:hypothetical protein
VGLGWGEGRESGGERVGGGGGHKDMLVGRIKVL